MTANGQNAVPADTALLQQMRSEGMERSQVLALFDQFVTVIGPRLTGTPEYKRAADYAREKLQAFGLANSSLEPWEFGRGWALDKLVVEIVEPRYMPLIAYAQGWSTSTPGEVLGAPIFVGDKSVADVTALKDKLSGAIVLTQPVIGAFVREDRLQPTTSDTPVRIGAPPMPRQGNTNQADARQVTDVLRTAKPGALHRVWLRPIRCQGH